MLARERAETPRGGTAAVPEHETTVFRVALPVWTLADGLLLTEGQMNENAFARFKD